MGWQGGPAHRFVYGNVGGYQIQSSDPGFLPATVCRGQAQKGGAHRLHAKTAGHSQLYDKARTNLESPCSKFLTFKTVAVEGPHAEGQFRCDSISSVLALR